MVEFDPELVSCFCDEGTDLLLRWESLCMEMGDVAQANQIDELFRLAHNLKGSSRSVGLSSFGNFIHEIENGITRLKSGEVTYTREISAAFLSVQAFLIQWVEASRKDPSQTPSTQVILKSYLSAFKTPGSLPRTEIESVEPALTPKTHSTQESTSNKNSNAENLEKKKVSAPQSSLLVGDETVRVSVRKIEQLIEMMGELSIHQSVVYHSLQSQNVRGAQLNHSAYLSRKITRELYEKTLSLRMVPIQPVFQRLERTIREMAHSLGKTVEVELTGGEVELDKTVSEKIIEPLTHMVRNSIDHGIEKPTDRIVGGKSERGMIRLSAFQDAGSVVISIEDDGKGLDPGRIRAKALSQGIIREETSLDPAETFALIFLPGFSTAEKVTDVSGRGVGMDVVMKTVESLKGEIKISSDVGVGTRFLISIPTTLSIIDALIIKLNETLYAVPVSAIDEILRVSETDIRLETTMTKLKDRVLPVVHLAEALNMTFDRSKECQSILISKVGKNRIAFRVDSVCEQQQIVVRKFSAGMANAFGLAGGTILGNGQPGLIIDLLSVAESHIRKVQPQERAA